MDTISKENRFVSISERTRTSDLPYEFWIPLAANSCYFNWKGTPVQKSPFQIVVTQQLIQELKPKTIIEFGSFRGGSALWLADIQSLFVEDGKVLSCDISLDLVKEESRQDPRITFFEGDSNHVESVFPLELLKSLPRPFLVIEDAHVNTGGILDYFHNHVLEVGDYVIVEDTNIDYNNACYPAWQKTLSKDECDKKLENLNNKIVVVEEWLKKQDDQYLIDTLYVDPFGIKNASKNWNSVFKKVR